LCLFDAPQWAVIGDTFPLGCAFSDKVVYSDFFAVNPDLNRPEFQSPLGRYKKGIGLDKIVMSWGHDEYMYQVCKPYLPLEALYMIRYHSFYVAHQNGEYTYLMNNLDKTMFHWVREFQPYDLYSKMEDSPDAGALRPYYCQLIDKYFPTTVAF